MAKHAFLALTVFVSLCIIHSGGIFARSPIEEKVRDLFQRRCAECHNPKDDQEPYLDKETDIGLLKVTPNKYIAPGKTELSKIYKFVTEKQESKRMPESSGKPGDPDFRERLTADEIKLIEDWINETAAVAAAPRTFIDDQEETKRAFNDLRQTPPEDQPFIRYLTLANLYNQLGPDDQPLNPDRFLDTGRLAVDKLLNSLSSKPEIALAKAVDATKTLLRIDLRDYGWEPPDWTAIEKMYPYFLEQGTNPEKELKNMSQSLIPKMRADWFIFATSQPPLYNTLLRLPGGTAGQIADLALEKSLDVDVNKKLRDGTALRLGFQESGVSTGNRLIERHDRGAAGYYWKSYDFDQTRQSQDGHNLFKSPLGPKAASLSTSFAFEQDGGEMIWSLPNGLQAYMLINSKGERIDLGPANIVRDTKHPKGIIINGISCISCHNVGMKDPAVGQIDQVRDAASVFPMEAHERKLLEQLYAKPEQAAEAFSRDFDRFGAALAKLGEGAGSASSEPVWTMYEAFFNRSITARTLKSEFGLGDRDVLAEMAQSTNPDISSLAVNFKNGVKVERQFFAEKFKSIAGSGGLKLGDTRGVPKDAPVEFGGKGGGEGEGPQQRKVRVVPDQFASIQKAIDASLPGDTVYIRAGEYTESLYINSAIILQGESIDKVTVRPATGAAAALFVDHCKMAVSGITFVGPGKDAGEEAWSAGWRLKGNTLHEIVVDTVETGGPAEQAGVLPGMRISRINGVDLGPSLVEEPYRTALASNGSSMIVDTSLNGVIQKRQITPRLMKPAFPLPTGIALIGVSAEGRLEQVGVQQFPGPGIIDLGISGTNSWSAEKLSVHSNGKTGLLSNSSVRVSNSLFASNGGDGLHILQLNGSPGQPQPSISKTQIFKNGESGLQLGKVRASLAELTVTDNAEEGIKATNSEVFAKSIESSRNSDTGLRSQDSAIYIEGSKFNENTTAGLTAIESYTRLEKSSADRNGESGFFFRGRRDTTDDVISMSLSTVHAYENKLDGFAFEGGKGSKVATAQLEELKAYGNKRHGIYSLNMDITLTKSGSFENKEDGVHVLQDVKQDGISTVIEEVRSSSNGHNGFKIFGHEENQATKIHKCDSYRNLESGFHGAHGAKINVTSSTSSYNDGYGSASSSESPPKSTTWADESSDNSSYENGAFKEKMSDKDL
ncbi:MAG: hypothetical protein ACAH88_07010 [Roseimicrobium sp.]